MTSVLNRSKLNNLTDQIWKSAERLRGKFKAYEYQSVIMPIIVIRRLECVLIDWRDKKSIEIRARRPDINDNDLEILVKKLELNPRNIPFSNETKWTLEKICKEDPTLLEKNFRKYIKGFSENIQEIIDHFEYKAIIGKMRKLARLEPILRQYSTEKLGPTHLSNLEMGYIYEELLRRFSEQSGEEAGEHFTPREIIRLMVELLEIPLPKKHISIYDPASGTGGMLSIAKEHLREKAKTEKQKKNVEELVTVHGHELQPGNYAICKADMLIKEDKNAQICYGNSLIPHSKQSREPGDQLAGPEHKFNYMLSNPPFGVTWGGKDGYEKEARNYRSTRYSAGMPRTNDGALLFLQTMLTKMIPKAKGGSRIAIIFNGSPLSNGDCGQGESEIRRWILEKDWLDAIVMLPDQLFYNTIIFTYIWLLTNKKAESHNDKVMIIDARKQFDKEPKSFGNKRNRILDHHRKWIEERYRKGWEEGFNDDNVKVFNKKDFAYHKVKVVFWQIDENEKPAYITEKYEKAFSPANIKKEQQFYDSNIDFNIELKYEDTVKKIEFTLSPEDSFTTVYKNLVKDKFKSEIGVLTDGLRTSKEKNKVIRDFIKSLETDVEFTHRHYVKDDEYIEFGEDIEEFLKREIRKEIISWEEYPQLGYEMLPNKYFYRYEAPKPAEEVLKKFWELEKKAENVLKGMIGDEK